MTPIRYTAPIAPIPFCKHCNRRFHAGGRSYVVVVDKQIGEMTVHRDCADEMRRNGDVE